MKPVIHFAHGNGFPARCYKQMLDGLADEYEIIYIDRIGHDPRFPVEDNWEALVHEIIESIKSQSKGPVIGLGHSLGGALSFLAAIEAPELFEQVLLLDSLLLDPVKSKLICAAKAIGMIDRMTPALRTKARREHWRTKTQLFQYLLSRDLFKSFSPESLEDYMTYGTELRDDGYHLRFNRNIEYQIYRTIPHVTPKYAGRLKIPAALIYGLESTVVKASDLSYMQKHFGVQSYPIEGSHLFPMERPKVVVEKVKQVLKQLKKGA